LVGQPHSPLRKEGVNNTNENKTALVSTVPLERLATPEEMARVIAFVASADASCMTGASIPVDGAMSAD
jgi:3-oxoacyl-[acyl-carrier protein] reductase